MERPRIIPVDPNSPADAAIQEAMAWLSRGEPVVLPTETVYGLVCRPDLPGAIERVFAVKERTKVRPLPRMVASIEDLQLHVSDWSGCAVRLAEKFWPGPLTLILNTATGAISFRIPDHPVLVALLKRAPVPLAVTSANRSGEEDSLTARAAANALGPDIPLILDAGPARMAKHHTVVDCTGEHPRLIDEAAISAEELRDVCEDLIVDG